MIPPGAGSLWSSSRVITSLIRLLPVPPPRPAALSRAFQACRCTERRHDPGVDEERVAQQGAAKKKRRRLDEVCLERYPEYSRNIIQSWIAQGKINLISMYMLKLKTSLLLQHFTPSHSQQRYSSFIAGKVLVNERAVLKAGTPVPATATVIITAEQPKFVCRAGLKLEAALDYFNIDPSGLAVLDSGLSTGGFTDCLLQRGATRVVGVDVGYGQVAERVRTDPRVTVMERTNLRHLRLGDLPESDQVDLVTLDLSFISSLKMRETVCDVLRPGGQLLLLIKPQFEAGKAEVNTGGVVRDPEVRAAVVDSVIEGWKEAGFACSGWMESPIKGATSGNIEYLAHFVRGSNAGVATAQTPESNEEDSIKNIK